MKKFHYCDDIVSFQEIKDEKMKNIQIEFDPDYRYFYCFTTSNVGFAFFYALLKKKIERWFWI